MSFTTVTILYSAVVSWPKQRLQYRNSALLIVVSCSNIYHNNHHPASPDHSLFCRCYSPFFKLRSAVTWTTNRHYSTHRLSIIIIIIIITIIKLCGNPPRHALSIQRRAGTPILSPDAEPPCVGLHWPPLHGLSQVAKRLVSASTDHPHTACHR